MRSILAGVLVGLIALMIVSVGGAYSQGPAPAGGTYPEAVVASSISYQGRLVNPSTNAPLSGVYDLEFTFWNASVGGSPVGGGTTVLYLSQSIVNGLFSGELPINQADYNGQAQWLQIRVRSSGGAWETLTPRVQILAAPYALSLRPGAQVQGDASTWTDGHVLAVTMTGAYPLASAVRGSTATGYALRGISTGGYGLYGYSEIGNAVVGTSVSKTAGVFSTQSGYGIRVSTAGSAHFDHAGYFTSNGGYGILVTSTHNNAIRAIGGTDMTGLSTPGGTTGVAGLSAASNGVFGSSRDSAGVYGTSSAGSGMYGTSDSGDMDNDAGVWGQIWSGDGTAVRGMKYGGTGRAVYGTNLGTSGSGVVGDSTNYIGVWGQTGSASHNWGIYTPDNLHALNYVLAGATMQVVQNGGTQALELGDVAAFIGIAAPLEKNGAPMIRVSRTSSAGSTAVAGVVYSRYDLARMAAATSAGSDSLATNGDITPPGPVAPGEYMLLVVQGPAQVKASALTGSIRPGDLLASAASAGYAAKAASVGIGGTSAVAPGTVLGKALEPLDADARTIYVYVTLQ